MAGHLAELLLPGPLDVLELFIAFFGSLAEAKQKLSNDYYALGFSKGMAAHLLGFRADEATRMVKIRPSPSGGSVGEQVAGWSGVREQANWSGAVEGWNFTARLGAAQRGGFLKLGIATIKAKGHTIGSQREPVFNLDDVVELAVALNPTIAELLEVAREQEAVRRDLAFQEATWRTSSK